PPCVSIALREATYTYANLIAQQAFTISLPTEKYIREADYFGIASGRNEDKFAVTGLTPIKSEVVNAPYVQEFPFVLECKVVNHYKIGLHTQFIGEILDIKVDEEMLGEKGPDINKIMPVLWAPDSRGYYGIGKLLGKAFALGKDLLKENK
ncbi:MAG: flavin reductase family protein, partial [Thermodesulfobacteriota bacterium]